MDARGLDASDLADDCSRNSLEELTDWIQRADKILVFWKRSTGMESIYPILRVVHVIAFVFMSVPLFNLIVVNERAALGTSFDYYADRYLENIIRRGATRCFVFQATVFVSGILLLLASPLGISAVWTNGILTAKTLILAVLAALLSYVHLRLQPQIEAILAAVSADEPAPADIVDRLRPHRVRRKRLATLCLFLVITTIILGMQVFGTFATWINVTLIALAGVFAWHANRSLVRFGWV